jgi:hemerythrin-like domain-containing protein
MKEHRVIERIIPLLEKNLQKSRVYQKVDTEFLTIVIDFFKTYADKIHHGKEEDILFKSLRRNQISIEHKKTMNQLIAEHKNILSNHKCT